MRMNMKRIQSGIFWLSVIAFWLIIGSTDTPTIAEKIMIVVIQAEMFGMCFKWKKNRRWILYVTIILLGYNLVRLFLPEKSFTYGLSILSYIAVLGITIYLYFANKEG